MTPETWIALAAANFALGLAPGQNAALVGLSAMRDGLRGGLLAMAGILAAKAVWSILALYLALGAQALSPHATLLVQVAGGVLLVGMGLATLRVPVDAGPSRPRMSGRIALAGLACGLANPKSLVFFLAVFPALLPRSGSVLGMTAFAGSAIVLSTAASLLPFLAAAGALVRAGQGDRMRLAAGGALMALGGLLMARGVL
jgi:threonine/homoserine/homoserine lactone efflux protein